MFFVRNDRGLYKPLFDLLEPFYHQYDKSIIWGWYKPSESILEGSVIHRGELKPDRWILNPYRLVASGLIHWELRTCPLSFFYPEPRETIFLRAFLIFPKKHLRKPQIKYTIQAEKHEKKHLTAIRCLISKEQLWFGLQTSSLLERI